MSWKGVLLVLVAAGLLCAGVALAAGTPSITRWVIAAGGGRATADGTSLAGTLGQWAVGGGSAGSTALVSGFSNSLPPVSRLFLPLIFKA